MKSIKWGVLGAAKIAREKVIPAMQGSQLHIIHGLASRDAKKAEITAKELGIPVHYGSYEALIDDPEIDAVYNPLPNDLHVFYTKKCIEAGKHVLCEKPLALKSEEILDLIKARDKHKVKVGEAFMVASNPQWIKAREIVNSGELGTLKSIQGFFSYHNIMPDNIRNISENGGGGVWDIGCYPVFTSRFVLGKEPERLAALLDYDPNFGTDRLGAVLIQYPSVQMNFSISTQLMPYQRMMFFGDKKALEVRIPFNAPSDEPNELPLHHGDILHHEVEIIRMPISNQYTRQGEDFSKAILEDGDVPVSLENAYRNTKVLEAIFKAAKEKRWVDLA
ncbi:Gfo/Idh/MocA family protein [Pleomorphovibrio marinus]|uniref:Gfo/Idh/MocA family protein n=1 Tax=Pleomorphovibrio marinus TaxID=2164132 RepID=UPI000E0ABA9D|nr:Gfo/Idh/MocA family oxidoreductase [Pleomorphovibrio marinus]